MESTETEDDLESFKEGLYFQNFESYSFDGSLIFMGHVHGKAASNGDLLQLHRSASVAQDLGFYIPSLCKLTNKLIFHCLFSSVAVETFGEE